MPNISHFLEFSRLFCKNSNLPEFSLRFLQFFKFPEFSSFSMFFRFVATLENTHRWNKGFQTGRGMEVPNLKKTLLPSYEIFVSDVKYVKEWPKRNTNACPPLSLENLREFTPAPEKKKCSRKPWKLFKSCYNFNYRQQDMLFAFLRDAFAALLIR